MLSYIQRNKTILKKVEHLLVSASKIWLFAAFFVIHEHFHNSSGIS